MADTDFEYGAGQATGRVTGQGRGVTLSILADRPHLRGALRDDATAAGARIGFVGSLADLAQAPDRPLGEIVWLDCPRIDAEALAVLGELDRRAAAGTTRVVVSTTVAALDDIYAWMEQGERLLLVDPDRVDRLIALAQVMARQSEGVRELSDDERLLLVRLTEQVGQIAGRIERMTPAGAASPLVAPPLVAPPPYRDALPAHSHDRAGGDAVLPDPKLVRRIIRQRQQRARFFEGELFADPAWDMLLDLTAAHAEGTRVSVTSLCIASGVPPTTALRWIGQMVQAGLFERICDDSDRRRAFIALSARSVGAMSRYFREVSLGAPVPV